MPLTFTEMPADCMSHFAIWDSQSNLVATIGNRHHEDRRPGSPRDSHTCKHLAQMFTAAPELLEAAKLVAKHGWNNYFTDEHDLSTSDIMLAAIAKAEGKAVQS